MRRGQVVLVDTNIIIEAVRTHCWNALTTHFNVETVEKCVEEARTGDPMRRNHVPVEARDLQRVSKIHAVPASAVARLAVALQMANELDVGERHLFAHALGRSDAWIASCADRAALKVAFALEWKDRMVSLESLAGSAGARPRLKNHFLERWMSDVRTAFLLEQGL
ncbi:hypothetical protein [Verrucomicrobium sp. 3C]|uniref:hypothetical protein n=1 Tax=Verrucomicrobium sp. 3C TaxID=1134055 RepID=UPI000373BDB1|nr:hypothetical protein [Verrucomicrobium sp. 3C]